MEPGPSAKRRKTTSYTDSQLPVTKFFKPIKRDDKPSNKAEEVITVEDSDTDTPNKEGSPELFSSPVCADLDADNMAAAAEPDNAITISDQGSDYETDTSRDTSRTRSLTPHTSDPAIPPWNGSPLNELCFGPSAYPVLPPLVPSANHAVLVKPRLRAGSVPQPYPDKFRDVWDQNHVRMPCSSKSQYPVDGQGLVGRWDLIKKALGGTIADSHDFEKALLSYNSHYAKRWSFKGLHIYFEEICSEEESDAFFSTLLPKIIELALSLPTIVTHAVPLLKKQQNYAITLSQQQIACLLANAFLCTFPRRNTVQRTSEYASYPFINFNTLFSTNAGKTITLDRANKLRCIFHYFTRVTSSMPQGLVTFQRQVLTEESPQWEQSSTLLTGLHVTSQGTIEDNGHGMLQVDFANKYLGGGVLNRGCVQEEIRFLICPELIASLLFTEELDSNECLIMTGAERFSNYRGYARGFEWCGSHRDMTMRDNWGRIQTKIVAIDALKFYSVGAQYKPGTIRRELNKAYCGFMDRDYTSSCGRSMAVATGNWGCGAFGGDPRLKSVIQLMAAAEAKRDVVYFTFGDQRLQQEISTLHSMIVANKVTVDKLWSALVNYTTYRTRKDKPTLFSFLHTTLGALGGGQRSVTPTSVDEQSQATVEYTLQ